jgi:hypothetical protein
VGAVGDGDFDVRRKRGLREGDGCITVVWLEVTAFVGKCAARQRRRQASLDVARSIATRGPALPRQHPTLRTRFEKGHTRFLEGHVP